jgi:hypothetical protein
MHSKIGQFFCMPFLVMLWLFFGLDPNYYRKIPPPSSIISFECYNPVLSGKIGES